MKLLLYFFFSLLPILTLAQTKEIVSISGYAPSYCGKTINVYEIEDYISMKESLLASTTVKEDSTFSLAFTIEETQKIILRADKNTGFLYAQPKGKYELFVPEKNKYEPYRPNGNQIELTFYGIDSTDINYNILQFQRWMDEFISGYYHLKNIKPMEFAKKLDSFKENVEKYYRFKDSSYIAQRFPDTFFPTFVKFSIASLDNIQHAADRNRYEKHDFYLKYSPVAYRNDAYMTYFNTFYEKMMPRLTMETNNRVYLGVLKSSPTLVMRALGMEYTLINVRIREMVMIKALSEEFYSNDFPQTNILTILDSVSKHSLFEANAVIARNMKERLTELVQGGKAPDFVLNGKTLSSYAKKHLYIHFIDPTSQKSTLELEPLKKIYETYKNDITFVTVYSKNLKLDEQAERFLNSIPWEKNAIASDNPLWNNYKIATLPSFVLIDGFGYVVAAPALGPTPNGQRQTIEDTFFQIKRINDQMKGQRK